MSDYIFKYTNQSSASFVVKPYTANGPASPAVTTPYVNSISGIHAFSINTPFVLVGKGVTDYGQTVQNNILYLAENFCNPTRPQPPMTGMLWYKSAPGADVANPTDPTVAGMYMWDGTAWNNLLINGKITSNVNLSGYRLTNVGDAVTDTDALNASAANTRYLQLSGGTMSGNLTMSPTSTVIVSYTPVANFDVANKIYVDTADLALQSNMDLLQTNVMGNIGAINSTLTTLYPRSGGTITGNVSIDGNLTVGGTGNVTFGNGSGTIDFGNRVVANVATPVLAFDAANKAYVDDTVAAAVSNISLPPTATADGVVSSGYFDGSTGILTLSRTQGLPPITVAGTFAASAHTHAANSITYDPALNTRRSAISESLIVVSNVNDAILFLDRAIKGLDANPMRTVVQQTVSGNTTFAFGDRYTYLVWGDRLMVFVNGIKQYADTRSESSIVVTTVGLNSVVGITPQTYSQTVTVDGTPYSLSIPITSTTTYNSMHDTIVSQLIAQGVPCRCVLTQGLMDLMFTFVSNVAGSGHTVSVASTAGQLFPSIPTALPETTEVGMTLSYSENGLALDETDTIIFHVAPPDNALIEATVFGASLD